MSDDEEQKYFNELNTFDDLSDYNYSNDSNDSNDNSENDLSENDLDNNEIIIDFPEVNTKTNTNTKTKSSISDILDSKPVKKFSIKKSPISTNKSIKESQQIKSTTPEKKETKSEQQFEFDQSFIETFAKGLDPKKVFIKNSHYDDEVKIICLLLKHNYIPEYKCCVAKCKVRKLWNGKPIQLLLYRKNKIDSDLSIENLELRCPNCYMQEVGLNLFKKNKTKATKNCKYCNYPLNNFSFNKQKESICGLCYKRMNDLSFQTSESQFINELQETYSENPNLSDDIKNTKYYQSVGQYKSFSTSKGKTKNGNNNGESLIKINTTDIPDIDDIVLE